MRTHLHVAVFLVAYCFVSSVVSCTSSEAISDTQSCAQEDANAFLELHDVLSGQLKEAKQLVERLEASIKEASGLLKSEAGLEFPEGPPLPPLTTVSQQAVRDVALPERSSWTSHSSILTQGNSLVPTFDNSRLISQRLPEWTDFFRFQAAVRIDGKVLCGTTLKRPTAAQPRFIVVGDDLGKLYFFTSQGLLAAEYDTGAAATAVDSGSTGLNTSLIAVGHPNGESKTLLIEQKLQRNNNGDCKRCSVSQSHSWEIVKISEIGAFGQTYFGIATAHGDGSVYVWHENGRRAQSDKVNDRIVHMSVQGLALLIVTTHSTLRWQIPFSGTSSKEGNLEASEMNCQGLDGHGIESVVHHTTVKARVGRHYAVNSNGQIITFGAGLERQCKVLHTSHARFAIPRGQATMISLQNAIIVSTAEFSIAYNTSGPVSSQGPQGYVASYNRDIALAGGLMAGSLEQPFALATSSSAFVMATQKNVLVFFSVIPPPRPAATSLQTLMWARPVIIVLVAFLAVWHFGNQRSGGLPFRTQRGEDLVLDRKHARRNNAAGSFFPSEYDLMGSSKQWARADAFERPLARGSSRIDMDLRNRIGRDESSQGAQHGRRLAPRDLVHRDFRGRDAREEEGLHSRMEASNRDYMKTLARHRSAGDSEILQNLRRLQPEAFGSIQSLKELDPLLSARQSLDAVAELDPQNLPACVEDETQTPPQ